MIPDPDADELAYIDEVIAEDDRNFRSEREWQAAQRRSAAAPVRKTGSGGLVFKEHWNSAPARALTHDAPDEEDPAPSVFGDPALDQTLSAYTEVVGEFIGKQCRQTRDEVERTLREEIVALRTEMRGRVKGLIELRGAFHIRGPYHEDQRYQALDVVTLDDRWYAARSDRPGPCPGPDWEPGPAGCQGAKGLRGSRGLQGAAGKDAPKFVRWDVDRANYRAIAKMSDGSTMTLELRPLFEQYDSEKERSK